METPWLTDKSDMENASLNSLERCLLTSDGAGKQVKAKALEEIKKRAAAAGVKRGMLIDY